MNINELKFQNLQNISSNYQSNVSSANKNLKPSESSFAQTLKEKIDLQNGVNFSKHAIERLQSREINLDSNDTLERLNKAVQLAQEKGSRETLIIVDSTAFLVNVQNNKVITTIGKQDMQGNVFTNIDSTVIM